MNDKLLSYAILKHKEEVKKSVRLLKKTGHTLEAAKLELTQQQIEECVDIFFDKILNKTREYEEKIEEVKSELYSAKSL